MDKLLLVFLLAIGIRLHAQETIAPRPSEYPDISVLPIFHEDRIQLNNESEIISYIESKYPWLKNEGHSLKLKSRKESPLGIHYHYGQFYFGKPVFYNGINVAVTRNNNLLQAVSNLYSFESSPFTSNELQHYEGFIIHQNAPYPVNRLYFAGEEFEQWETFTTYFGDTLWQHDIKKYLTKDTLIRAKVFLPNPIQSARTIYGTPFVNASDSDVPMLLAQQKTVSLRGVFENDTFKLKSGLVRFGEVSGPKTLLAWSLNDSFFNNRSHDFFEDQNSFYHFQVQMDYLKKQGFANLLDSFIIDAHAHNGGDNSSFNPFYFPYQFEFGTGGVEDAEDGQVVIHELGHAFSELAAEGTSIGKERNSMEEGTCDYFSVSYSRTYNDHQWYKVFSWDGHNEFWEGFFAATKKVYPNDITDNENKDREIWSSPLMCIYEKLGKLKTDSLVLSHLYLQAANTTMPQMARTLLKIDTVLWNGRHMSDIWSCFVERGILGFGADVPAKPFLTHIPEIRNSWEWATGQGTLSVVDAEGQPFQFSIFNQNGQMIYPLQDTNGEAKIASKDFQAGTYVLYIKLADGRTFNRKLVKF